MNRKAIITIQIIIAAIALTYFIMPDLLVGPFDDGVLAVLAICAEVALFIVQAVRKPQIRDQTITILVISKTIRITHIRITLIISIMIKLTGPIIILTIRMMSSSFLQDVLIGNKLNQDIEI